MSLINNFSKRYMILENKKFWYILEVCTIIYDQPKLALFYFFEIHRKTKSTGNTILGLETLVGLFSRKTCVPEKFWDILFSKNEI